MLSIIRWCVWWYDDDDDADDDDDDGDDDDDDDADDTDDTDDAAAAAAAVCDDHDADGNQRLIPAITCVRVQSTSSGSARESHWG